jgi:DNA ligase (NAD+)
VYSSEQQIAINRLTNTYLLAVLPVDERSINDLRAILRYHDWRYYVLSEPVITDSEYDFIFRTLKSVEEKNPDLITPDSPTQRVAKGLT